VVWGGQNEHTSSLSFRTIGSEPEGLGRTGVAPTNRDPGGEISRCKTPLTRERVPPFRALKGEDVSAQKMVIADSDGNPLGAVV